MKYLNTILIILSILLFSTNPCYTKTIDGSGNIIKESRSVSGFHNVSISGSGYLFISQGDNESLVIECDDNIAPYIRTIVRDGTLEIRPKNVILYPSEPIKYHLSLKNLNALRTSGSLLVRGDALRTGSLSVVISGSGKFTLRNLEAQSITLDIIGSGEVHIESGKLKNQKISINGSGEFDVPNLKSENIDFTIIGSGKATVWVTDDLNIKISGGGKLYYYGSPRLSSRISGSGKVESLGIK